MDESPLSFCLDIDPYKNNSFVPGIIHISPDGLRGFQTYINHFGTVQQGYLREQGDDKNLLRNLVFRRGRWLRYAKTTSQYPFPSRNCELRLVLAVTTAANDPKDLKF